MAEFIDRKLPKTEEDLLELQEKFLREKGISNKSDVPKKVHKPDNKLVSETVSKEPTSNLVNSSIKDFQISQIKFGPLKEPAKTTQRKKSLFRLNYEKSLKKSEKEDSRENEKNFEAASSTVDVKAEMKEIHEENLKLIQTLSNEEILQKQKEIIQSLKHDTSLIEFLKNMSKNKEPKKFTSIPIKKEIAEDIEMEDVSESPKNVPLDVEELPLDLEEAKKWPHMDVVEPEKLSWMTMLPKVDANINEKNWKARFDFTGNLIPPNAEINISEGLHHHGEEQERAGYSIEELFHLSQSSLASQKIIVLNIISHILEKNYNGHYEKCFDEPILNNLLNSGLVAMIRLIMDDTTKSLIFAATHTLASLLNNPLDELVLDTIMFWHGGDVAPFLTPTSNLSESEEETKETIDVELTKGDLIKGLLERMNILQKLKFMLKQEEIDDSIIINDILMILLRISRHSLDSATNIFDCHGLLDLVINKFLPNNALHIPNCQDADAAKCQALALKLIRVLAQAGENLAKRLLDKFPIKNRIISYLGLEFNNDKVHQVFLEALKIWRVLAKYNLVQGLLTEVFPILMRNIHAASSISLNNTNWNLSWEIIKGALGIFTILITRSNFIGSQNRGNSITLDTVYMIEPFLQLLNQRWLTELVSLQNLDANKLSVVGQALNLYVILLTKPGIQTNITILMDDKLPKLTLCLSQICESKGFIDILNKCSKSIIQDFETIYHPSLPQIDSFHYIGDTNFMTQLPFSFLSSFYHSVYLLNSLNPISITPIVQALLSKAKCYLPPVPTTTNKAHFLQFLEHHMSYHLAKLITTQKNASEFVEWILVLSKAFAGSRDEDLLRLYNQQIVFNPSLHKEDILDILPCIRSAYFSPRECSLNCETFTCTTVKWPSSQITNKFWYLQPLSSKRYSPDSLYYCLTWIKHVLLHYPLLMKDTSPEVFYYYLSQACIKDCCFEPRSAPLLKELLVLLKDCNFKADHIDKHISLCSDYTTFFTYYKMLLEEFDSKAYQNNIFSMFILLPLQMSGDPQYRELLLTDYSITIRYVRVFEEDLPVTLSNFLLPFEDNVDIIKSYKYLLQTGELIQSRTPVLYKIAMNHYSNYEKLNKN